MAEGNGNKLLVLVHGRKHKPAEADLKQFWVEALEHGIKREYGSSSEQAAALGNVRMEFVYYGDLSNDFFEKRDKGRNRPYDATVDTAARRATLGKLKKYKKGQFTENIYLSIRARWHAARTLLYGGFAWLAGVLWLPPWSIRPIMPDVYHYWKNKPPFGPGVRSKMETPLLKALEGEQDIMVVAHSLGAIVTYDVLVEAAKRGLKQKLSHFVTIGSPLGISYIQRRLSDWPKHPDNIVVWDNVSAKDDYVSLDRSIQDEFEGMAGERRDHSMFNLAVKEGKAHQHHATGYLVSPEVAGLVAEWLVRA